MKSLTVALLTSAAMMACKSTNTPAPAQSPRPQSQLETPSEPSQPVPPAVVLESAPLLPPSPLGLPAVVSPAENPTTPEKVALGWRLFFDKRLSKDGSMACAACHHIDKAFTSGMVTDTKVGGAQNSRNAPTMLNLGYHASFYWDGRKPTLEAVTYAAWTGQLQGDPATVSAALNAIPTYRAMFERAFGKAATSETVVQALAAWLRVLQTGNSPWDKSRAGDATALSTEAKEGQRLFQDKGCVSCHVPPLFSDFDFHNAGLGADPGRKDATKADADVGRFKTPTLRNVALSAPYFHDGSVATLEEAIAFMARGGNKNPQIDPKFKPQKLSPKEAKALKAFLEALTGDVTFSQEPPLP